MIRWLLVLLYVTALFLTAGSEISSAGFTGHFLQKLIPGLTSSQVKKYVFVVRKFTHVAAYGLLTLLVYLAAWKTSKKQKHSLAFAIIIALLVAVLDERYQRSLPYRTGSWVDVVIDGVGISLAAGVIWFTMGKGEKSLKASDKLGEDDSLE